MFLSFLLTFFPKKLILYFSKLNNFDPSPVIIKLTPDLRLKPGTISCFFKIWKISSSLSLTTLKIKFLLIFLKFESIKKFFFKKLFSSKSFELFSNEKSILFFISSDSLKFKEQTYEMSLVI